MSEHGASSSLVNLLGSLETQAVKSDFSHPVPVEPHTEVGEIAVAYNRVREKFVAESKHREIMVAELLESEERTRTVIENSLDAVISVDETGCITEWNTQAEKTLGWQASEVLGQKMSEKIIPPSYRQAHESGFTRYLKTGDSRVLGRRIEIEALRKDGVHIPIELSITMVRVKGRISFCAFIRDISSAKADQAQLFELIQRNKLLLESAGQGIYGFDLDGVTTFVNPAAAEMLGYTRVELIGIQMHAIVHHTKTDGTPYLLEECPMYAVIRDGEVQHVKDGILWRKDGTSFPIEYTSTPMKDETGQIIGAVVVFSDITERQKFEMEREEQASLMRLKNDVSQAIIQHGSCRDTLQACAEILNQHLDGAFCRIWTHNEPRGVLELQASAGMYTHITGTHAEIPIGQFKIGLIAQNREPCLTNEVVGDLRIHDQEWAKREGIVAFAGYPLLIGSKLLGVLGIFAHHSFSNQVLDALHLVTDNLAIGIERIWAMKEIAKSHWENERILTAFTGILIGVNENHRITKWNSTAATVFEIPEGEVLDQKLLDLPLNLEWPKIDDAIVMSQRRQEAVRVEEVLLIKSDGTKRTLGLSINPMLHDEHVELSGGKGYLILGSDITEKIELENQLSLAQKMESIGQLAAGVAHEINTPMQFIHDNLAYLQSKIPPLLSLIRSYATFFQEPEAEGRFLIYRQESQVVLDKLKLNVLEEEIPEALHDSLEGAERVTSIVRAMKEFSHPGITEKILTDLNKALEKYVDRLP